jgi:uncharacterized lipoprotein NlpE involved in copper resistance
MAEFRRWPAVLALVVLGTVGCGSPSTLSKHSLGKEAEAVQSTAAEGATLAAQIARGRTTEPFARIHAAELAEQAKKTGKVLRQARAPGLETDRRNAADTAARVEQALERLHFAPTDRELARRLQHELEQAAAAAAKLAG